MHHKLHDLTGEQKEQLLVIVDQTGKSIGTATRHECHTGKGKTHLAFLAFVIDAQGLFFLTRRSKQKSLWPGYWDASVVSHVLPGETPESAANRRGKEELGVDVSFTDVGSFYYFAPYESGAENEYCHVLVGKTTGQISPNPVEIDMIKKVGREELKRETEMHKDAFTPWMNLAIQKFGTILLP